MPLHDSSRSASRSTTCCLGPQTGKFIRHALKLGKDTNNACSARSLRNLALRDSDMLRRLLGVLVGDEEAVVDGAPPLAEMPGGSLDPEFVMPSTKPRSSCTTPVRLLFKDDL